VLIVLLLLAPLLLSGCATSAAPPPPVAAPARTPGFFWTVSTPRATVHLLGSIHVGARDLYPLPAPIERAFESASTLVLEVDLGDDGMRRLVAGTRQMTYPPGDSLDQHLSAATLAGLRARLAEAGIPEAVALRLRPWAVPMLLTVVAARRAGRDALEGIDLHFARRARGSKTIVGIETPEQQLAFFAAMPEAEQVLALEEFLAREGARDAEAGITALTEAWRAGDDATLERIFVEAMQEPAQRALYEAVFVKRNVTMVEAIERFLAAEGTYFVVVGTGHLVGPDSVVAMLRRRGHRVRRE
jgi:uncharacterized protein YbaP (TraB family)